MYILTPAFRIQSLQLPARPQDMKLHPYSLDTRTKDLSRASYKVGKEYRELTKRTNEDDDVNKTKGTRPLTLTFEGIATSFNDINPTFASLVPKSIFPRLPLSRVPRAEKYEI